MSAAAAFAIVVYVALLALLAWPLGAACARALAGERTWLSRLLGPLERAIYRFAGVRPADEMDWRLYARAFLLFSLASTAALYLLLRVQHLLPGWPAAYPPIRPDLAFNIAASFSTNTNWQSYSGEGTVGYVVAALGLIVQNFVSPAAGLAVLLALIRGFARRTAATVGNFWADLVRATLYVMLPAALVLAVLLISQGVVQTWGGARDVPLLQPTTGEGGKPVAAQSLPLGPVAAQTAIALVGTNGGGYYNANSAHPFANPTPLANFAGCLALLLLPAALCFTFGRMVGDRRQGAALFAAMAILFALFLALAVRAETRPNPALAALGVDQRTTATQAGGYMEGKEVRFGPAASALWATATTAASNGAVNAAHDSFSPLGGMVPLALIGLGEVVFGGVGSGLYGMLTFVIVAVFLAGLMVGRTPEYLGKKIESYETKMAALAILATPVIALLGTAVAVATKAGLAGPPNPGPHGFSEILYAFTSAAGNNGSAFAGLDASTPFYNVALGIAMLAGRFFIAVPVLAVAGSLARKKIVPPGAGTLPTHTPLFVLLLCAVVLIVGALNFVPALALGPIVEHLRLAAGAL